MQAKRLSVPDIILFTPKVFGDERGFFYESFNQSLFGELTGFKPEFVQDNHSKSQQGVLRGLHYQLPPKGQGKLVRVVQGAVFDVAVDIRKNSSTFGQWVGVILSAENKQQMWIPAGFAHGFLTLSDTAEFLYKTTDYYSPGHERCILWNDADIGIAWPTSIATPQLSAKDQQGKPFSVAELYD
ncbi:MAG: dTDP-4-dehydrorhamnose 3,5-epimerase [Methylomonas sp.]|uniref:dTDP-4-dehydrorhamnose 3,5-epimerase n=1 Tax=Methylomonas sp. TaxID=418 RepID=UPI0025EA99EF|nr:dTDP-4-dehydrorhamnose 3,5-epimerase [Methylomonas sp.]MCK9606754.1 dTDP-4-dehydrorhamnose 3,5-epimerase [Methylomonas sp.]